MNIAVIDLETTSKYSPRGYIIEIGIVELDLETGDIISIFNSIVKENGFDHNSQNAWIFNNSDLKFSNVLNAPTLESVKDKIQDVINTHAITAFNKKFDLGYLKNRGFLMQKELPCIMISATNFCKIPKNWGIDPYKYPTVQEAWDFFFPNTAYIEKHRALDDAKHEAMILYKMGCWKQIGDCHGLG